MIALRVVSKRPQILQKGYLKSRAQIQRPDPGYVTNFQL